MKEIKFRAWSEDDRRMEVVTEIRFRSGAVICNTVHEESDDDSEWLVEIPLMQYTGLKDKNVVEIYESDFVDAKLSCADGRKYNVRGVVVFNEFEYCIEMNDSTWPLASFKIVDSCEVIGNIYQNPELLNN